jgi:F-type H+-transporting ATPase subunit b
MTEVTQTGVLESLGINWMLLIAQFVNFAFIVLILWLLVYRPLMRAIDKRNKKIADGLSQAEQAEQALFKAEQDKEAMLRAAEKQAEKTLSEVRQEAIDERKRLQAETQAELERQLSLSREKLKQEKEHMVTEAKKELGELVVLATAKVTEGELKIPAQKKIVEGALSQVETL